MSDGHYIAKVFLWAWKAGINVGLYSKSYEIPVYTDQFQMPRTKADYPVFRFERGDKKIEFMGRDFSDLVIKTKQMTNTIAIELMCPEFDPHEPQWSDFRQMPLEGKGNDKAKKR